ncbi:glycosyltransferase, partial [Glaciecola sp.]|nr:glycosyltransferase [Glaciecola sp.]
FKSFIPDFLKGNKFTYLPNGVDEDYFKIVDRSFALNNLELDNSATYILFVSSKNLYRRQKRYDLFQDTIAELRKLNPSKNYQALTMSTDDRNTALLKFNASSIHFLSSDYEGSPNSVKEALCCGVQVVTREAGSVRDLVSNVPGCVVVDSDDPCKLAYTIDKNLVNEVSRMSIRKEFLKKNITRSTISNNLVSLYSKEINHS